MKRRNLNIIAVFLLALIYSSAIASDAQKRCEVMPLFARYHDAGLLSHKPNGTISLKIVADLHSADCGAPDCYGTNIVITMNPSTEGRGCIVRDVLIQTQDFVNAGCESLGEVDEPRQETFFPEGGRANLSEPTLKKLTFRNKDGTRAIVLLRENFFYFENVTRGGVLRTELPGDDDDESCCWGATSSEGHFTKSE